MAAMPLARIARELAAQGNIRISKSGLKLSGQNNCKSASLAPPACDGYQICHRTRSEHAREPVGRPMSKALELWV